MKKNIILATALASAGLYSSCTWQPLTCHLTEAALSTDAAVPVAVSTTADTPNYIYQKGTQFYQPVTVQYAKDNGRDIIRRSDHPTPNLQTAEEKAARFILSDTDEKAVYYFPLTPAEVKQRVGNKEVGQITYMGRIPVPAENFEQDETIKQLESLTAELPDSCRAELPGDTAPCRLLSLKTHGEEPSTGAKLLAVPATLVDLGVNATAFAVEGTAMLACSLVYVPYTMITGQEQAQPEPAATPAPTPAPEAKSIPAPEATQPALPAELQKPAIPATPAPEPEPAPAPAPAGSPFLMPVAQPQPGVEAPTKL